MRTRKLAAAGAVVDAVHERVVSEISGSRRHTESLLFIADATVLVRYRGGFISPTDPDSLQRNEQGFTV
jgi:hypothetical protein